MQASKFVAAILTVVVAGGGAYALATGTNVSPPREAICANGNLNIADQEDCRTQMKAAKSEIDKQQVATRFQSRIEMREAAKNAGSSASTSSSGGVSADKSATTQKSGDKPSAKPSDAASGALASPK